MEQCKNGAKSVIADTEGKLTTGKEYTIRVLKEGLHVRCYLDGSQILDTYLKEYANRQVYASANIDDANGLLYVKLVNPGSKSTSVKLSFNNGRVTSGQAEALNSANGTDENTVGSPTFITPRNRSVTVSDDGTISYNVAPFSVNVLKLNVTDVEIPVAEALPEPALSYSFDDGTQQMTAAHIQAHFMVRRLLSSNWMATTCSQRGCREKEAIWAYQSMQ
jgi:hypothetical protein